MVSALAAGTLCGALAVGVAVAASGPPVLEIPGLTAARIEVANVSRLDDGGALIAASMMPNARSSVSRLAVVRLLVDGTVDLGYGTLGISIPRLGSDVHAISLAINPRTGEAWIGITQGAHQRGGIVALDGNGRRVRRFGRDGVQPLGAGGAGRPVALAWEPGELVAAAGAEPCRGCTIRILNPSNGALQETDGLVSPEPVPATFACSTKAITSVVFASKRTIMLTATAANPGCGAQLLTLRPATTRTRAPAISLTEPFGTAVITDALATDGRNLCLAGSGRSSSELGPLSADGKLLGTTSAPTGQLTAVVALGQRACAALFRTTGGGLVVQAVDGQRHPTRDRIPRGVTPLGMFRCHQHLLVIGARRVHQESAGVVVAIPVRRGPQANAASRATGCR